MAVAPTPVVALNRCVAVAEVEGPARALELVDQLGLDDYHLFHSTRADLLRRLGRRDDAIAAYDAAIALQRQPGRAVVPPAAAGRSVTLCQLTTGPIACRAGGASRAGGRPARRCPTTTTARGPAGGRSGG